MKVVSFDPIPRSTVIMDVDQVTAERLNNILDESACYVREVAFLQSCSHLYFSRLSLVVVFASHAKGFALRATSKICSGTNIVFDD
jgi:hypothetical protein